MELRILAALLLGAFVSCVTSISAQGSRLLVVLEDEAEKSKYGQFWLDLEGTIDSIHSCICSSI